MDNYFYFVCGSRLYPFFMRKKRHKKRNRQRNSHNIGFYNNYSIFLFNNNNNSNRNVLCYIH